MMNLTWSLLTTLLLGLMLLLPACNSMRRDPDISAAERAAQTLLRQGKYQESFDAFLELRKAYPNSYIPLQGLARCSAMLGKSDLFEFYAMEASSQAPSTPTAHGRLGALYVAAAERFRLNPFSRQYAEMGCLYLSQALAADRNTPQAPYNLGVGFYLLGRDAEAINVLQDVLRRQPGRLEAIQVLLSVYRRGDKPDEARELLKPLVKENRVPPEWKAVYDWAFAGS